MKSIGIIPARGGSKGIPGKNKKLLNGVPLINYTVSAALGSELDCVIVSSDDDQIIELSRLAGAKIHKRCPEIAEDGTPTLPVLLDVLNKLDQEYDLICTLQPTSPFRSIEHINNSLALMKEHEADSLVSVCQVPHNMVPESIMVACGEYVTPYLSGVPTLRRQDKMAYYARNGAAIYITKRSFLDQGIWGGQCLAYKMNSIESLDIDTLEDWKMAEAILLAFPFYGDCNRN